MPFYLSILVVLNISACHLYKLMTSQRLRQLFLAIFKILRMFGEGVGYVAKLRKCDFVQMYSALDKYIINAPALPQLENAGLVYYSVPNNYYDFVRLWNKCKIFLLIKTTWLLN